MKWSDNEIQDIKNQQNNMVGINQKHKRYKEEIEWYHLRWMTSWKRTEEKRNTDKNNNENIKIRKEELDNWKWNKKDRKENENEKIKEWQWEWWKSDSKRMKEGNRNKLREWERIETRKGPKQKPEDNVVYEEH